MTRPSMSVVVPCFNQGRYLAEALESVLSQSLPPSEVIVVDDGSTDGTSSIARSYSGVRYVRQDNRGLANARNRGLEEAAGDYVVFLDADDRLVRDGLAVGFAELDERPGHAFVFGRCERIDEAGRRLPTVPPPPIDGNAYEVLLRNNVIWTPAIAMFRRAACAPFLRFDARVGPAADYDLYLRIARERRIHGHGQLVAEYRLHEASMSSDAALMLRSTVTVLRRQQRHLETVAHVAACEYGLRSFRHYYGEQLVEQMRSTWKRPGSWGTFLGAVATLLRYHPGGAVRGAARWLQRLLTRGAPLPRPGARTRWRSI